MLFNLSTQIKASLAYITRSKSEMDMLFQRIQVRFPAPTTITSVPVDQTSKYMVYIHSDMQNIHTYKVKTNNFKNKIVNLNFPKNIKYI